MHKACIYNGFVMDSSLNRYYNALDGKITRGRLRAYSVGVVVCVVTSQRGSRLL